MTAQPISKHVIAKWVAILAWLLLPAFTAQAAPFRDLRVVFSQPDGTPVELIGSGDEFYARFETPEGYTVIYDRAERAYVYARLDENGSFTSRGEQVHRADPAKLGLERHLRESTGARKSKALARIHQWEAGMRIERTWKECKAATRNPNIQPPPEPQPAPPPLGTVGAKVGLTLLIDFEDLSATIPRAEVVEYCNGDNYSGFGNNGSVKSYFHDNSNGLLTYTNVVTVYIRIPNSLHPRSYYNDITKDCASQGNLLVRDALNVLKALPNYNTEILPTFDPLSVNSNGEVAACNVLFAGPNSGDWGNGLWQHSWALTNVGPQELSPGGKRIWKYQATPMGNALKLGVFCHETGHLLCGFPDIYDYDGDSRGGAGEFCLMNSGAFDSNPVQLCAYLKRAAGWATTVELTSGSVVAAALRAVPGVNFNRFYRYQKPGVATEYFLLEARYQSGRDAFVPASGVAIWHIDELGDRDNQSMSFNTSHLNYEVSLEQADNLWHLQNNLNGGDASDLHTSQNAATGYTNAFLDATAPTARWWDGTPSGANFHDFSARGTTMTFLAGTVLAPQVVTHPQSGAIMLTKPAAFALGAAGASPLRFQWYFQNNPITGATNASHAIASVDWTNQGTYHAVVTNQYGRATSEVATLTVLPYISFAEALDISNFTWTTSGGAAWATQEGTTHDGIDAVQSGPITNSQQSLLETTVNGPGVLAYWWKVSSEQFYDKLELYLDGLQQSGGISGEVAWEQKTLAVPSGPHSLRWRYSKDTSTSAGQDCGWLDQVVFVPVFSSTLPEALDTPPWTWSVGGAASWTGQSITTHDGVDAAESGLITHGQETWMETTLNAGAGTLRFWWRASSQTNNDYLEFHLNGTLQTGRLSGEAAWQQKSYAMPPGTATLRWRYVKNGSINAGQDRGWVDEITFTPNQVLPPSLSLPRQAGGFFQMDVSGSPSASYIVLCSTNLVNWVSLRTNMVPFTFSEPCQSGPRFFRAQAPF